MIKLAVRRAAASAVGAARRPYLTHFTASRGTILMLMTPTRFCGLLISPEALGSNGCVGNLSQCIVTFNHFAERGVFAIEILHAWIVGGGIANEELAAGGIRVRTARHGNDAEFMRTVVEFSFDGVSRSACAPFGFLAGVFGKRVATLNHEAFDDAMKACAIIKSFTSEFLEIGNGFRRNIRPEFDDHFTVGCVDDRNFMGVYSITHGCVVLGVSFCYVGQCRRNYCDEANGADPAPHFHG